MDGPLTGLFLIILTTYCATGDTSNSKLPDENITAGHELRKQLLKNYDKIVVPATSKKPVHMKVNAVFNSVEMSYETSHMIIYANLKVAWIDDRLTWDPNDYDKINFIAVEHNEIWHPDIMAYNNIEANTVVHGNTQSIVFNTGDVLWVQPVQYRIYCQADMTHWPYDKQTGLLIVGSWVYSTNAINITDAAHEISLTPHTEWQILRISSDKITKFYSCCPNEPYVSVEYNITINRKSNQYHPVVFVPALCTALLNLLVFGLSLDDCRYKLTISLFDALIVVVILQVLYSKIPLILSTVPLIALYYTYSLGLIVLTAIISVVIKNMTITRKPLSKPISNIVESKFIEFLAMGVDGPSSSNQTLNEDKEIDLQYIEYNKRQTFAKIIDKICFIIFSIIYVILLSRFVF
ncbi:acetylcholine receptor subunit alpha-like isoform X1 [Metopolophium dirhodum]|uniref:acetylcholine receptor subunit alpha-like isoform X1 n=1 Tax=Metopolophium dirhodum TaxID=44670 RepID=UPI00298F8BBE|nr:acetylcholine receptor subunit alpha-like isoform X1 [Metopolophium dirhodum]